MESVAVYTYQIVTSSTGLPMVGEKTKNKVSDLFVPMGMLPLYISPMSKSTSGSLSIL